MEILKSSFHIEVRNVVWRLLVYIFICKDRENQNYVRLKVYSTQKYAALKENTKGFNRKLVDEKGNFMYNVVGFY